MPLIFVYGSLKKGFRQHARHMKGARFVSAAETAGNTYNLYAVEDPDAANPYPALFDGGKLRVMGELYEIDDKVLGQLDAYEGEGYERREIALKSGQTAFVYFFLNPENLPLTTDHPQIRLHGKSSAQTAEWIPED